MVIYLRGKTRVRETNFFGKIMGIKGNFIFVIIPKCCGTEKKIPQYALWESCTPISWFTSKIVHLYFCLRSWTGYHILCHEAFYAKLFQYPVKFLTSKSIWKLTFWTRFCGMTWKTLYHIVYGTVSILELSCRIPYT